MKRLLRLGDVGRDLDDELRFHFESVVQELVAKGMTREDAEAEADRRFGDRHRYRSEIERVDRSAAARHRRRGRVEATGQALRFAFRSLRRSPGLSAGIVLAFALGIGANATMFGIIDRLLLSPPAHFEDPASVRRIVVERQFAGRMVRAATLSIDDVADFEAVPQFEAVGAYSSTYDLILGGGMAARPVTAAMTTGNFWDLAGVSPRAGRFYGPAEDRIGAERVVVIGHGLWRSEFDGAVSAIGARIDFGWGPYIVIGVAPAGFTGARLGSVDLWLPARAAMAVGFGEQWITGGRSFNWLRGLVRLAPDASLAAAEEAATALHRAGRAAEIADGSYDGNARVVASPLIEARGAGGSREARVALWLAGVSAIVLLIACVNVANLLLARSLLRRRETVIRLAIGVSRARLLGQTIAEGLLLSLAGGAAALFVARWGGELIRGILLPDVEWTDGGVGIGALAVVVGLAVVAGLLSTIIPAIESQRRNVAEVLRATSGNISRSRQGTRLALAVAQAALSVVLLVGAGLFVRSLDRVRSQDLGFEMENLYIAEPLEASGSAVAGAEAESRRSARRAFFTDVTQRLAAMPGIEAAAHSIGVPFWTSWSTDLAVPGRDSIPTHPLGGPYVNVVSRDYFRAMDLRIVRGRGFEDGDYIGDGLVVVVNQAMADFVWPGEDPLGECLRIEELEGPCTMVVGIVETARRGSLVEEPNPQFYVPVPHPVAAGLDPEMIMVRTTTSDAGMQQHIRDVVLAADPGLRYAVVRPLESLAAGELRAFRLGAALFSAFGLLALIVAALGLYSVLAFDVAQRTREIGLRAALGATTGRLLGGVVGNGMRVTAAGVLLGLLVAGLAAPAVRDLLFEVSPWDPITIAAVSFTLLAVAVIAGLLPAWRAANVDPNVALRAD